jgi:threonine/homoserine/homoserine lactone efflux protein
MVVSLALTRGSRPAWQASLGVITANAFYFALAACGVTALVATSSHLFVAVRWVGAAYLIGLGLSVLRSTSKHQTERRESPLPERALRRPFIHGFIAHGANPNLLVYFAAILPQFVDTTAPLAPQVALIAGSSFVIELVVLAVYAGLAARAGRFARRRRLEVRIRQAGGLLLIGAGAKLAVSREP